MEYEIPDPSSDRWQSDEAASLLSCHPIYHRFRCQRPRVDRRHRPSCGRCLWWRRCSSSERHSLPSSGKASMAATCLLIFFFPTNKFREFTFIREREHGYTANTGWGSFEAYITRLIGSRRSYITSGRGQRDIIQVRRDTFLPSGNRNEHFVLPYADAHWKVVGLNEISGSDICHSHWFIRKVIVELVPGVQYFGRVTVDCCQNCENEYPLHVCKMAKV